MALTSDIKFEASPNILTCKVCGGNLVFNEDGSGSTCESCATKYTAETMKKMLVEISGGKVEVEGIVTINRLAQNGETFIRLGEWEKARGIFQKMTDEYPEDYRGWWGMLRYETRGLLGHFSVVYLQLLKNIEKTADTSTWAQLKAQVDEAICAHKRKLNMIRTNELSSTYWCLIPNKDTPDYARNHSLHNKDGNIWFDGTQEIVHNLDEAGVFSDRWKNISHAIYHWVDLISDDFVDIYVSFSCFTCGLVMRDDLPYNIEHDPLLNRNLDECIKYYKENPPKLYRSNSPVRTKQQVADDEEARRKAEKEERINYINKNQPAWRSSGLCQYCGGQFSFLSKTCKCCGKIKDY